MYRVDGVNGLKLLTGIKSNGLGQKNLVAFFEGHDGFLPAIVGASLVCALAAGFATYIHRVHAQHFDFEQLLHGLLDLRFARARISHHGVLIKLFTLACAFFGQAGGFNDGKKNHWEQSFKRASSLSKAPRVNTSLSLRSTW